MSRRKWKQCLRDKMAEVVLMSRGQNMAVTSTFHLCFVRLVNNHLWGKSHMSIEDQLKNRNNVPGSPFSESEHV